MSEETKEEFTLNEAEKCVEYVTDVDIEEKFCYLCLNYPCDKR